MAERVAVMYAGQIAETASVEAIFSVPAHPYTRLVLATLPGPSTIRRAPLRTIAGNVPASGEWPEGCRFSGRAVRWPMGSARAAAHIRQPGSSSGLLAHGSGGLAHMMNPLLSVRDLCVHYASRHGDRDSIVSGGRRLFDLRAGETLALVGESGCGKSSTAYAILGLERATGGTIEFEGKLLGNSDERGRSGAMQIVFQDPSAGAGSPDAGRRRRRRAAGDRRRPTHSPTRTRRGGVCWSQSGSHPTVRSAIRASSLAVNVSGS